MPGGSLVSRSQGPICEVIYDEDAGGTGYAAIPLPPGVYIVHHAAWFETPGAATAIDPAARNVPSLAYDDGSLEYEVPQDPSRATLAGRNFTGHPWPGGTLYAYGHPTNPNGTTVVRHRIRYRY